MVVGIVRHVQTLNHKHPEKDAVLIDYSVAIVIMPTVLVSSYIGAKLNILLPTIIILIFGTIALGLLLIRSIYKARQLYREESIKKKMQF